MITMRPNKDFRAGKESVEFLTDLEAHIMANTEMILDLSSVIFMDSFTIRLVFENFDFFSSVIPPQNSNVIAHWNNWLDAKKF